MEAPYRGTIDVTEAVRGIHLCLENARALVDDAEILRDHGRPARAIALSVIALEELGKLPKLANVSRYERLGRWSQFWRSFRSHVDKLDMQGSVESVFSEDSDEKTLEWLKREASLSPLQELKLRALYVDWQQDGFCSPSEIPDLTSLANSLINWARSAIEFHNRLVGELDAEKLTRFQARSRALERFWDGELSEEEFLGHLVVPSEGEQG